MSDKGFITDPGWDTALINGHDTLIPERHKVLKDKIIDQNLVCSSQNNVYVFNPLFNSWFLFIDIQTVLFLNSVMDLSMASVNYDKAFKGYIKLIESRAMAKPTREMVTSICVGSRRLKVHATKEGLEYMLCERLVRGMPPGPNYDIVASFPFMSLDMARFKDTWEPTYEYPLYRYIASLFADNPIGLETVKWIIGKALIDPTPFNKVLCLWGEGEKGKSKLIQAITIALKGCIASIPEESLVSMTTGIPDKIKEMVVTNRIVTAGDVDNHFRRTNLAFFKSLTGQDGVSIPPTSVVSQCSLIYSTNTMDSPKDNLEYSSIQIARRFNIVHMCTHVPNIADQIPQDMTSRWDMINHCVYTAMRYPDMPMSIGDLMLSLLQNEIFVAIEYISYLTPQETQYADEYETITANLILASFMGVKTEEVGRLAARRTRNHVKKINGIDYVIGIVPSVKFK